MSTAMRKRYQHGGTRGTVTDANVVLGLQDVDQRRRDAVAVEVADRPHLGQAVAHQAGVEARAAHVDGDEVAAGQLGVRENTIVSYDALHADLALTLARGYAVADEEAMLGVRAIAVPVFGDGEQRPWAAVSVFAPAVRFGPAEMEAAVALAKDAVGGFAP
jgi:Bacterial transcriptional regulator